LFDELGAGTDPTEGAALAMSILENLLLRKTRVIATTHYSELKIFAYHHDGVENASVEFDIETLRPTYRLLIGVPGRSNAFEVSQRLGLSKEIIDYARSLVGSDQLKVEDMLSTLEENMRQAKQDREEANLLRNELEQRIKEIARERKKPISGCVNAFSGRNRKQPASSKQPGWKQKNFWQICAVCGRM